MNPLKDILTGGITGVIDSISGVLGKFIASPEDKIKAQLELTRIATDFQVKVLEADRDWAVAQAGVVTAETKSESWMARNWRPITMLTFVFIIAFNYIISPLFSLKALEIVPDMWSLLKIGLGGYIIGRSAEKTIPQVAEIIKK